MPKTVIDGVSLFLNFLSSWKAANISLLIFKVEGASIDLAHHNNWAKRAIIESAAMEAAVELAASMTDETDTLLIVTSDHQNTLSINGYPNRGSNIFGEENISLNMFIPTARYISVIDIYIVIYTFIYTYIYLIYVLPQVLTVEEPRFAISSTGVILALCFTEWERIQEAYT